MHMNTTSRLSPGRKTLLAVAVTATLLNGTANATPVDWTISTSEPGQNWATGNLIITQDGSVTGTHSAGIKAAIGATLGTLTNSGTITGDTGLSNSGSASIQHLSNTSSGVIIGVVTGIDNFDGTINTLDNSGQISGTQSAIDNGSYGQINTLNNKVDGTLIGNTALSNRGTIGALNNDGVITGTTSGISNAGNISTLNNSGVISGSQHAIWNSWRMGIINNSGTIAGAITNISTNDLIINGASGSIFGVLTGFSGDLGATDVGLISSNTNVKFYTGKLLLNDNMHAGSMGSPPGLVENNGATLQINNNISMYGNYTQVARASLLFGVADGAIAEGITASDSGYGRLTVDGSVTLAAGTTVGLTKTGSAYTFAQGQRYLVITAQDGAHSNFNEGSLNYNLDASGLGLSGKNVALTDSPGANALVLTVVSTTGSGAVNGATTSDARSSLGGLFNYQGLDPQLMNLQRAGAALGSTDSANNGGAQLSPASTASAAAIASTGSTQHVLEVASNHMDNLRTAQLGNGASGIATGEASGMGTGLWGQAFGGSSRQDEREDIAGYHANYHGMLIGADADLNDSWRAGGLFSYSSTSVNNDGANKHNSADIDSYGLIAYATYTANQWYVNLSAGAVQHQYDTKRQISLTGFDGTAKGDYDGMQYLAAVQAGYPIDLGSKTTLTPIAGLTYSTLKQDSYTEKDGNGAALHVNSDDIDSLKSDLGAKLERSFATSYGELIPAAQLTWRHEFRDEGLRSVSNFSADVAGETSFSTNGPSAINDTGVLNLGVTLVRSNRLSLSAKYTLEAGSGYTANTGNLQARWDF